MGGIGSKVSKQYTLSDVESYGIKWQPSMKKLTPDFQQSVINQIGKMYTEFPELQGIISQIKVVNGVKTDMGFMDSGPQKGAIIISGDYANKTINQLGNVGNFFVADDYSQLVTHEMAHAVGSLLGANSAFKVFKDINNKSDLSKLSTYANDMNDEEKFAEAVTDYMIHGNKAQTVSKQVVSNIHKLLKK